MGWNHQVDLFILGDGNSKMNGNFIPFFRGNDSQFDYRIFFKGVVQPQASYEGNPFLHI